MKVKICGITRAQDAQLAVQLGAWAIGFIFYEKSQRSLSVAQAKAIIEALPPQVVKVGVFVNETIPEMLSVQARTGITIFQLHGEETPETANGLPSFIKAIRPKNEGELTSLSGFSKASYFLVDTYDSSQYGGTGRRVDVELAKAVKSYGPLILAGGLNADNVARAISEISPFAVDVSSGVEASVGVKDPLKLQSFFKAVALGKES